MMIVPTSFVRVPSQVEVQVVPVHEVFVLLSRFLFLVQPVQGPQFPAEKRFGPTPKDITAQFSVDCEELKSKNGQQINNTPG